MKSIKRFFKFLPFFGVRILFLFVFGRALVSCNKEIVPPSVDEVKTFSACVTSGASSSFEIVTFNAGGFPRDGYKSVDAMASLIKAIDPDVVAFQEIASVSDFDRFLKLLPGWTGYINPTNNDDWDLAYIFKTSEIEVRPESEKLLFVDDKWAFPRSPHEMMIKHKSSSRELFLINLHLKCCGGSDNENSRKSASVKLKSYIDASRSNQNVIVLGDFNDEILSLSSSENPFLNLVNDSENYRFADMKIAKGSTLWWSYPSYPSHIDHMVVTNELFSTIDTTFVIKVSPCFPSYESVLSDHRPLEARFKFR